MKRANVRTQSVRMGCHVGLSLELLTQSPSLATWLQLSTPAGRERAKDLPPHPRPKKQNTGRSGQPGPSRGLPVQRWYYPEIDGVSPSSLASATPITARMLPMTKPLGTQECRWINKKQCSDDQLKI